MNLAVKTVNADNLAQHVAEKRGQGANIASHEDVARIATAIQPEAKPLELSKGVTEKAEGSPPEPQVENPYKKAEKTEEKDDKENPFAKRIKELTKEKRELEEFAEGEYNARLNFQKRLEDLEKQKAEAQPKVEEDPEPDPAKYNDQKLFLKDWGEWTRKKARDEFAAEQEAKRRKDEADRLTAELNQRSNESVAAARKEYSDFDERMQRSPVPWNQLPAHFRATLMESEYGAHILYGLLEKPEKLQKILGMRAGAQVLEIGKLAAKFSEKPVETPVKAEKAEPAPVIPTSRAPAPMPSLNGAGEVAQTWNPSAPQPFSEYKRRKLDENRRKAR